jgi:hypothetical protein
MAHVEGPGIPDPVQGMSIMAPTAQILNYLPEDWLTKLFHLFRIPLGVDFSSNNLIHNVFHFSAQNGIMPGYDQLMELFHLSTALHVDFFRNIPIYSAFSIHLCKSSIQCLDG